MRSKQHERQAYLDARRGLYYLNIHTLKGDAHEVRKDHPYGHIDSATEAGKRQTRNGAIAIVIDAYTDTPVPTEKLRRALGDNSEYLHAVDLFLAKPKPCTITAAHTCAEHPAVTP